VDPQLIDRLICTANAHPSADYIGYAASQGGPAVLAQLGVFAEWCCAVAVYQADREAVQPFERSDATRYIYSHPEIFKLRLIPVPAQLDRPDLRLKVNFEEDWDHAQTIFEALGPEALDWQRIAELLDQHPALRQRMAALNRSEQGSPAV
jgi:spore coat polysaccharide biosynthesis protein SpsF